MTLVRPPLEGDQSIRPEDCDETIDVKKSKRRILQTLLAEIGPLTPTDAESQDVVWSGRNGWLKEFNQIARRRNQEHRGSDDGESSEEYDSDYIYDGISPPGERRKSCTMMNSTSQESLLYPLLSHRKVLVCLSEWGTKARTQARLRLISHRIDAKLTPLKLVPFWDQSFLKRRGFRIHCFTIGEN